MVVTVVVGVDGSGRTHRLDALAAAVAGPVVRLTHPVPPPADLAALLDRALTTASVVLADDVHRYDSEALRALTAATRRGLSLILSRRPAIDRPELAELDEAAAQRGQVEVLAPLPAEALARLVATVTGRPSTSDEAAVLLAASGGLPAFAVPLARAGGGVPAELAARIHRRLALLGPGPAAVVRILALRLEFADEVLANASGLPVGELGPVLRALREEGFLVPAGDGLIPVVAEAVLAELAPAERRRDHDAVARALLQAGADPLVAAGHLRAAQARGTRAADVYRIAGERLRLTDPTAALAWYDAAEEAGADPSTLRSGRAEASALLGLPSDVDGADPASDVDVQRLALVEGAVAAQQGRADRAAEALVRAGGPGPVLAVPALVAIGRLDAARAALAGSSPVAVRRLAEASLALTEPTTALPLLIEAAEATEQAPPPVILPDTPHALAALAALLAGDVALGEYQLENAVENGVGGAVGADRHRLLLAFVRMRAGRYDTAQAELRRLAGGQLPGRERLLQAALSAGIARRSGDIARLRDAWSAVEPVLARRTVDLFQAEAVEELVVAAARLRRQRGGEAVLAGLDAAVAGLGSPPAWVVTIGWIRLQVAIATEDAGAAAAIAKRLATTDPPGLRQRAQVAAAIAWAKVLADEVDPDPVAAVTDALAAAELPWEASRLAGQAAIRTTDPTVARRLLERARDLSGAEAAAPARGDGQPGGLSEREIEVARLVLAGRTYKDIGGQLYISPKTVEHHVARIRTKLGAGSRAEFVAALRDTLAELDRA